MIPENRLIQIILLFLPLLCITCIERNNPWDPANGCPEEVKAGYRQGYASEIEEHRNKIMTLSLKLDSYTDSFSSNDEQIKRVLQRNVTIKNTESLIRSFNDSIENYNKNVDCISFVLKRQFAFVDTINQLNPVGIKMIMDSFEIDSLHISSIIADGNVKCQPLGIYTKNQFDSIIAPLNIFLSKLDSIINQENDFNNKWLDTNNSIRNYNQGIYSQNEKISAYNDSIQVEMFFCHKNPIVNVDTLKERIGKIGPGDTLILAAGSFSNNQLNFSEKGDHSKPIVLIGSPGMETILESMHIYIENCRNIKFENLIIQNSKNSGVKIEHQSDRITFTNCIFRGNKVYGIDATDASVSLINCQVQHNDSGGIRISGNGIDNNLLYMDNVVISHNNNDGVHVISCNVIMYNSTISDNQFDGVKLVSFNKTANFSNSIFSFNGQNGINRIPSDGENGFFFTSNSDFFQNSKNDINADSIYLKGNIPYRKDDPVFTDRVQDNYRIMPSSKLYASKIGYQYNE